MAPTVQLSGKEGRGGSGLVALNTEVDGVVRQGQGGRGQGHDEEEDGKGTVVEEYLCLLEDGFGLCVQCGVGRGEGA